MQDSNNPSVPTPARPSKVTVPHVRERKGGSDPLVMVTAYDAPTARIVDEAGADLILVGDSLGMVVLGHPDTLRVDVEDMVRHSAAVARTAPRALIVTDMPYLSYHTGWRDAVLAAGRLIRDGGAEAVKLEGGRNRLEVVQALIDAEIPVMGHLGLTPQSLHTMGGYKVQGRALREIEQLHQDARALTEAGVFSIVFEGIPTDVARELSEQISVPTIGIGAGSACDGQVLVFHDLVGLSQGPAPKFVRRYAELHEDAVKAVQGFCADVRDGSYPSPRESYRLPREVARVLREKRTRNAN